MVPISYTDTDKIRAVLGLSLKDMPDDRLAVRDLEKELNLDLASWVTNIQTLTDAVNSGTATQTESDVIDSIGLYATYFCAKLIIPSLQLATVAKIGDGKNSQERFANINWDSLYDRISERISFYRKFISDNNTTTATAVTYQRFSAVAAAYDPVTGI